MLAIVKQIHLISVALSFLSFFLRGVWMLTESPLLTSKPSKILPHIIDTVLLVSGISMVVMMSLSLGAETWLIAKIVALIVYIIIGTIAIKRGKTKAVRTVAWVLAMSVFVYIYLVARTHSTMLGL
ncbi:MAG: SirB2 family protein [Gammaproteobacteria bacterium]|nr:SirB2 family protein [Gammaproteobacteria bacterium]MCP5135769.1 SirB2 family protein [Gammaproteobacteria bacterium]